MLDHGLLLGGHIVPDERLEAVAAQSELRRLRRRRAEKRDRAGTDEVPTRDELLRAMRPCL
jgi:hypothetical protein